MAQADDRQVLLETIFYLIERIVDTVPVDLVAVLQGGRIFTDTVTPAMPSH